MRTVRRGSETRTDTVLGTVVRGLTSALLAATTSGCRPLTTEVFRPSYASLHEAASPAPPETPLTAKGTLTPLVVQLSFELVRVEFPLGDFRDARKVWNHVDEVRGSAHEASQRMRNGLRIGVGEPSVWPAIEAILASPDVRVEREQLSAQANQPPTISLGTMREPESVFVYGADRRFSGTTIAGGEKLVRVDYEYRPEAGGATEVRVRFEIRRELGVMTWERKEGVIREIPAAEHHAFDELTSLFTLSSGEFLVIGLSENIDNAYLVGRRLLSGVREGQAHETILFLTPKPLQVRTSQGRRE